MAANTKIEWTHRPGTTPATLNALAGCQKISPGCQHCYAIPVAHVRGGNPLPIMQEKFGGTTRYEGGNYVWTGRVGYSEKTLLSPILKTAPHTFFVNSLSDLFYEGVTREIRDRHFAMFSLTPQHTHMVLTKRSDVMYEYLSDPHVRLRILDAAARMAADHWPANRTLPLGIHWKDKAKWRSETAYGEPAEFPWPLPNVWLGVSAENQACADLRVPFLLETPAAIRFVSAEPLIGEVDFTVIGRQASNFDRSMPGFERCKGFYLDALAGANGVLMHDGTCHEEPVGHRSGLDWVICGGESGRDARPMNPEWARKMRDDCRASGVAFFMKQMGSTFGPKKGSAIPADLLVREWPHVKYEGDASQSHPSQAGATTVSV